MDILLVAKTACIDSIVKSNEDDEWLQWGVYQCQYCIKEYSTQHNDTSKRTFKLQSSSPFSAPEF